MHGNNTSLAVVKTVKAPCPHKRASFPSEQTHRRAGVRWVSCHVSTGSLLIDQYTHPSGQPNDLPFSPAPGEDGIWHFSHITHTQVNEEPKQRRGRCVAPALDTWRDTQAHPAPTTPPSHKTTRSTCLPLFLLFFLFLFCEHSGVIHTIGWVDDVSRALFDADVRAIIQFYALFPVKLQNNKCCCTIYIKYENVFVFRAYNCKRKENNTCLVLVVLLLIVFNFLSEI